MHVIYNFQSQEIDRQKVNLSKIKNTKQNKLMNW